MDILKRQRNPPHHPTPLLHSAEPRGNCEQDCESGPCGTPCAQHVEKRGLFPWARHGPAASAPITSAGAQNCRGPGRSFSWLSTCVHHAHSQVRNTPERTNQGLSTELKSLLYQCSSVFKQLHARFCKH